MHVSKQKIYDTKNNEKAEAATSQFPTRIACDQSSEPIVHTYF